MTVGSSGGDLTKLGRWTWVYISGKDGIAIVFVLAYRLCHNPDGLHTVWSQQAHCFKEHEDIKVSDIHPYPSGIYANFWETFVTKGIM